MKLKFVVCALVMSGLYISSNIAMSSTQMDEDQKEHNAPLIKMIHSDRDSEKLEALIETVISKNTQNVTGIKRKREDDQQVFQKTSQKLCIYEENFNKSQKLETLSTTASFIEDDIKELSDSEDELENGIIGEQSHCFTQSSSVIDQDWLNNEFNLYMNLQRDYSFKDYLTEATDVQDYLKYFNRVIHQLSNLCDNKINHLKSIAIDDLQYDQRDELEIYYLFKQKIDKLYNDVKYLISNFDTVQKIKIKNENVSKMVLFHEELMRIIYSNPAFDCISNHFFKRNEDFAKTTKKYIFLESMVELELVHSRESMSNGKID